MHIRTCPISIELIKVQATSGWLSKRSVPGKMPWISNPPKSTAAVGDPGIDRVKSGTRLGPTMALLADSAAMTPSG